MNLDPIIRVHGSAEQHSIELHIPLPHDPAVMSRLASLLADIEHTARQQLSDSTAVARWKRFRSQLEQAHERVAAATRAVKAATGKLMLTEASPGASEDFLGDLDQAQTALATAEKEQVDADAALAVLAAKAPPLWDAAASTVRAAIGDARIGLERTLTERAADARAALVEKLDELKHVFAGLATYHLAAAGVFGQRDFALEMAMRDEHCGPKPEPARPAAVPPVADGVIQMATRRVG